MISVPEKSVLVLEVRNDERRQVSFCAFDFKRNQFLWKDVKVSEPWWVNLKSASENRVTLSKFENTSNPDSISYIRLDLLTASILEDNPAETFPATGTAEIIVPAQYFQGTPYFDMVSKFIQQKLDITPVQVIEYLENSGLIFISIYCQKATDLENHLLVFDENGELQMREKLGSGLKGLGFEAFFLQTGYLFYVKNKVELVSYQLC